MKICFTTQYFIKGLS